MGALVTAPSDALDRVAGVKRLASGNDPARAAASIFASEMTEVVTGAAEAAGEMSPWADVVGPCYTVGTLCQVLGVSSRHLSDAGAELRLLRLPTADGVDLFPTFQVRGGQLCPGMASVLAVLRRGIDDPWTWAQWLNSPGCNGVIAVESLWKGDVGEVLRDAERDACAWRS